MRAPGRAARRGQPVREKGGDGHGKAGRCLRTAVNGNLWFTHDGTAPCWSTVRKKRAHPGAFWRHCFMAYPTTY
jgi:hypothetical protein